MLIGDSGTSAKRLKFDSDVEVDVSDSLNFISDEEQEQVEADAVRKHKLVTTGTQSWSHVCKHMHSITRNLPFDARDSYRLWLLTKPVRDGEKELHVEDLPKTLCEGRGYLDKGLVIPYPSGPHWCPTAINLIDCGTKAFSAHED